MPRTGVFYTLTADARLAWPTIKRSVKEGIGADRTFQLLRDVGLSITRQTVRELVEIVRVHERAHGRLRFLNLEQAPNLERLPQSLTVMRKEFAFIVRVKGTNLQTGLEEIHRVTVSTDTLMTRRQLEEKALDAVTSRSDKYPLEVTEILLEEGYKAGPLGMR